MPKVRPNGAQRWANRTAAATGDYQAGIASPRASWQQQTIAAKDAHKAAVTAALADDRFAKGVAKAGDGKWQRNAAGKGAERFGPGAAAGIQDYETGVQKYLGVIENTVLPPRGPKGDPRNIERVRVLAAALRKAKTGFGAIALILCLGVASLTAIVTAVCKRHGTGNVPPAAISAGILTPASAGRMKATAIDVGVLLVLVAPFLLAGAALDLVSASATAAAAAGSAMAAIAGDTLIVRNAAEEPGPRMLTAWVKSQTSGFVQITHPSGHDQVRDLRLRHVAASVLPLLPIGWDEPVEPQEALTLTLAENAVAGDIGLLHMLMYYPDLPGIQARLIDLQQLESRMVEMVTIEDSTTATAGGTYSGSRAITAASDLLIANTDYALIGANIGVNCGALTVRGSDVGGLRVGIPGMAGRPDLTAFWFPWLTQEFGIPLIPVFNSANKGNILIENVQDENLAAVPFALILARLSS